MAAECEEFLAGADSKSIADDYRWRPYVNWAKTLNCNDTIVTFNYDRVCEILRPEAFIVGQPLKPPNPFLWKMHGSVDWRLDDKNEPQGIEKPVEEAIEDDDYEPALGIPGRSKDRNFPITWGTSEAAIARAEEIHIVGYSLPESDARSRDHLLKALNQNSCQHLKVSITLGTPGFPTDRLKALIEYALPQRVQFDPKLDSSHRTLTVVVKNMWAQDLLDAYAHGSGWLTEHQNISLV